MKYAVVESGGKQYIARPGEMIEVDHVSLDIGKPVKFKNVLLAVDGSAISIGQPNVKGAVVEGTVVGQIKGRKVLVLKFKPRVRYRRKQGHRQRYTQVSIQKITLPQAAPEKAEVAAAPAAKMTEAAEKATTRKAAPKKRAPAAKKAAAKPTAKKRSTAKAGEQKPSTAAAKPAAKKTTRKAASETTAKKKPDTKASKPAAKKGTTSKKTEAASKKPSRSKKEDKK